MATLMRYAVAAMMLLAVGGCSSANFMVYKDTKHFYVTSSGPELKRILCDSGDMDRIAHDSDLPTDLQKELKGSICATKKVKNG